MVSSADPRNTDTVGQDYKSALADVSAQSLIPRSGTQVDTSTTEDMESMITGEHDTIEIVSRLTLYY